MSILASLHHLSSAAGIPVRNNELRLPCPAHHGSNPTALKLAISPDGSTLLAHCHSHGCSFEDILRALEALYGVQLPAHRPALSQAAERRYVYRKPGSPALTQVELRYNGPCNRPGCRAKQAHKHCWREPRGLPSSGYLLMLHQPAQPVPGAPPVVAEGEKTAQAIADAGYPAYSYIGGTAGAGKADYSPLRGQPLVLVAPDNDQPGVKAAQTSASMAHAAGVAEVRILPVSSLPRTRGSDLADVPLEERRSLLDALSLSSLEAQPVGSPPVDPGYVSVGEPYGSLDCTPMASAMRFLRKHGSTLMLAFDVTGHASIYGAGDSGVWRERWDGLTKLISQDASEWVAEGARLMLARSIDAKAFAEVSRWGKDLQRERGWAEVWAVAGTALRYLEDMDLWPDGITVCQEEELDSNLRYIGAPNGVVDLDTGDLLTGAEARACLVTRSVPDPYAPSASHPVADSLLSHLSQEERNWLLRAFGYTLRGLPSRRIYVIQGAPGRGKSTLLNAMRGCLGDASTGGYGFALSNTAMVADKITSANSHSEHLVHFPHGRIATASDLPDRRLDTSLLKTLSGGDPLPIRRVRERSSLSRPARATLFISLNEGNLHNLDLGDEALAVRVRILNYPPFEADEDETIVHRVGSDPEIRQAIFAMLVQGALDGASPPEDITTVREAHIVARANSLGELGDFVQRIVGGDVSDWLSTGDLWQAALEASGAADRRPWSMDRNYFTRRVSLLRSLPVTRLRKVHGRTERGWWGYRLTDAPEALGE